MSDASDLTSPENVQALIARNRAELERTKQYLPLLGEAFGEESKQITQVYVQLLTDNIAVLEALVTTPISTSTGEPVDTSAKNLRHFANMMRDMANGRPDTKAAHCAAMFDALAQEKEAITKPTGERPPIPPGAIGVMEPLGPSLRSPEGIFETIAWCEDEAAGKHTEGDPKPFTALNAALAKLRAVAARVAELERERDTAKDEVRTTINEYGPTFTALREANKTIPSLQRQIGVLHEVLYQFLPHDLGSTLNAKMAKAAKGP